MVGADSLRSDFGGCQSLLRCLLGGGGGYTYYWVKILFSLWPSLKHGSLYNKNALLRCLIIDIL